VIFVKKNSEAEAVIVQSKDLLLDVQPVELPWMAASEMTRTLSKGLINSTYCCVSFASDIKLL